MSFESATETSGSTADQAGLSRHDCILDVGVLSAFDKVKSDDGSNLVIALIDLYLKAAADRIQQIRVAGKEEDLVSLRKTAHTFKGSSSTLGLQRMARACEELERLETHSPRTTKLIESMQRRFVEAREALLTERNRRLE